MNLLFLVNGSDRSAAATRAQAFASRLPADWRIQTRYRPARKPVGILTFTRAALRLRPDIIYVMDTAYSGVLAGAFARRALRRARLITDTGDAAYALALSAGTYSARQLDLIRRVEKIALTRSDAVVVRGSYHKTLLENGDNGVAAPARLAPDRVAFVPDGVDLDEVGPVDASDLRARLGLGDSLVLGMVGTMVWSSRHRMCYGWDIVEALTFLKDADVKALLVGDGDGRVFLEKRAAELGVAERIVWAGALPYHDLPAYLSAMDVCVSTQSNDVVGNVRTTGKLPLYLACGRYVAASAVGEARSVLPGIGCLLPYEGVRDDDHPARLAAHVRDLLSDRKRLNVADAARAVARENFDYAALTRRVETLCRQLVSGI